MAEVDLRTDVLVVGAGNAGLCAAVSALETGAEVIILEKAPKLLRGGNTAYTGFYRFAYDGLDDLKTLVEIPDDDAANMFIEPYPVSDFAFDLMHTSGERAEREVMDIMATESLATMQWLTTNGMTWEVNEEGGRMRGTQRAWQPGTVLKPQDQGTGILRTLFAAVDRLGGQVMYDAALVDLLQDEHGVIEGAVVNTPNGFETIGAASIVLAAGGFEASAEKRAKYLGKDWDVAKVRGSRFNTGEVLETALKYGAATTGEWSGCHATMVHASAPKVEMGQEVLFPLAYPYGIIVDRDGQRFTDEGADFYLHTYAALGRTILNLPGAKAFQIFDAKSQHLLKGEGGGELSYAVPHHSANTLGELAEMAGINPRQFEGTVDEFNSAIQAGDYDPSRLDGKRTNGLAIDKLNWAMALDTPPFRAYPVECGITFTYGGLSCTVDGQVLDTSGRVLQSIYAIGELAGTFYSNYVGGSGLTKGAVFGYRAGRHAGSHALQVRT